LQHTTRFDHILERSSANEDNFVVKDRRVTYIREKKTDVFLMKNTNIKEKFWSTLRLEVSTVDEYDYDRSTSSLKKTSKREVTLVPYVPDIRCCDEEIRNYSKQLWAIAVYFGSVFDD
jgi:hypothetical protein